MNDFKAALAAHLKAIKNKDLPAFAEFLHPTQNTIIILPNGSMIEGYDNILDFHKDWFADMDWSIDVKILDIFAIGDMGYALLDVVYNDIDQDRNPYSMKYFLSLIFAKIDGKWILLRDQNTLKD